RFLGLSVRGAEVRTRGAGLPMHRHGNNLWLYPERQALPRHRATVATVSAGRAKRRRRSWPVRSRLSRRNSAGGSRGEPPPTGSAAVGGGSCPPLSRYAPLEKDTGWKPDPSQGSVPRSGDSRESASDV